MTAKKIFNKLRRPVEIARDSRRLSQGAVVLDWFAPTANWGDALNPYLVERLAERKAVHVRNLLSLPADREVYSVVGSILQYVTAANLEVWGSGFVRDGARMRVTPRRVHAVRGPLSRDLLLAQGIDCPPVYGDPAILLPWLYRPGKRAVEFPLGLVPHYKDKADPLVRRLLTDERVLLVDVESGIEEFVDTLCRCGCVISSSLHGLIAADAYGIPAVWVEFGDRVAGAGFKFQDYFASLGMGGQEPVRVERAEEVFDLVGWEERRDPLVNAIGLVESCPFIAESVRLRLLASGGPDGSVVVGDSAVPTR